MCRSRAILRDGPPQERDQLGMLLARWHLPVDTPLTIVEGADAGELDARWEGFQATAWLMVPRGEARFCPWRMLPLARFESAYPVPSDEAVGTLTAVELRELEAGPYVVLRLRIWLPNKQFMDGWWDPSQRSDQWTPPRDFHKMTDPDMKRWQRLVRVARSGGPHPETAEKLVARCLPYFRQLCPPDMQPEEVRAFLAHEKEAHLAKKMSSIDGVTITAHDLLKTRQARGFKLWPDFRAALIAALPHS
jgi:hypothetical protein